MPEQSITLHSEGTKAALGSPFNGCIRFSKMAGARSDSHWVEINRMAQLFANPRPLKAHVRVRGIEHRFKSGCCDNPGQFASAPTEKRAQQLAFVHAGQVRSRPHCSQTAHTGPARKPHQECFRLIVRVVGRGDRLQASAQGPRAQGRVARFPRALLQG